MGISWRDEGLEPINRDPDRRISGCSISSQGLALGAVASGWAADRFGRRNVFVGTMVLYSIATGLCALSPSLPVLLFCRFWVGFGLGGQLPVAVSLVSDINVVPYIDVMLVLLVIFMVTAPFVPTSRKITDRMISGPTKRRSCA